MSLRPSPPQGRLAYRNNTAIQPLCPGSWSKPVVPSRAHITRNLAARHVKFGLTRADTGGKFQLLAWAFHTAATVTTIFLRALCTFPGNDHQLVQYIGLYRHKKTTLEAVSIRWTGLGTGLGTGLWDWTHRKLRSSFLKARKQEIAEQHYYS